MSEESLMKCVYPRILMLLTTGLTVLLLGTAARAGEILEFYNGVRSLGMGGVNAAIVNDETALYTNPAALGRLRDPFFTLADPEISINSNFTDIVRLDNFTDVFSAQGLLDALNRAKGKHYHTRFQLSPSIALPNFAIGALMRYQIDGEVDRTGTDFQMNYTNDWAVALGYSFRFWDGIIKLGFNAKVINRVEVNQSIPASTTGLELKNVASEGVGISSDIGLLLTAPIRLLPVLAIVARDVGDTKFDVTDGVMVGTGDRRPVTQKQKLDAGFSLSPIGGKKSRYTISAELRDVLTKDEAEKTDLMRRLHVGAEMNVADFFFLRAGMNQRYWTAGFELANEQFQLQGATYGEDIGSPGSPREDRRYMGKFSLRF